MYYKRGKIPLQIDESTTYIITSFIQLHSDNLYFTHP